MSVNQTPLPYLQILKAGPLTLLQDAGRSGVRHLGITQGGPMDWQAWACANALVGSPWGSTALEINLGGLELQATEDCWIAICGADLAASVEHQTAKLWQSFALKQGQSLRFKMPISGLRAYLAIHGGFHAPQVLGSTATVVRDGLGGLQHDGQKIQAGNRLYFPRHSPAQFTAKSLDSALQPDYQQIAVLDLIPGAQIAAFSGKSLYQAFNSDWQVDTRADRMGIRLIGPRLNSQLSSMISEGINLGAVQVPPDGQPIVLMNDRQTIGGYPRLGTLTPLACSRLAQCAPGQHVKLQAISVLSAQEQWRRWHKQGHLGELGA